MNAHEPPRPIRLLCAEDSPDDMELIGLALARHDPGRRYVTRRVETAADFVAALDEPTDLILCDFHMPRFSPHAALQLLQRHHRNIPLVVVTRAIGEEAAVDILRCGAKDYVTKDRLGTLPQVIARVLLERRRAEEKERLAHELEGAYRRLKELSARLVRAQERERSIISRELHDHLGQSLTAVTIHLEAADRAASADEAREHRRTAVQLAGTALAQLKTLSFTLRPAQLDLLGVMAAVRSSVQSLAEPAGIAFEVTARGEEPRRSADNAAVALRLVREAMTNIVRHAQASLVQVRIRFLPDGRIGVLVADDGVGFDKRQVLDGVHSERNFGLYNMIERTELAGGEMQVRASPGRGCVVRAVI